MGHRQQGGESGLPRRPPALLALLNEAKDGDGRELVLENLRVESREAQSRLKEQLKQFRTEVDIFLRLMYKSKNQHRHSLYYRRLLQVRRDLRLLDYPALDSTVEGFTRWTFAFKPSLVNLDQRHLERDQISSALRILLSATRILNQIDKPIIAASTQLLGLLSQSFFMSVGLTIFSTLARLRVLSQQLLFEFATVYNLLSVFSEEKSELFNPKTQLPVRRPPFPLHLECHWDGGKLFITEIERPTEVVEVVPLATPLSSGLWFVDDRESSGVSKSILMGPPTDAAKVSRAGDLGFADDRTGVKYDVCVSAITAKEEAPGIPEISES